MKRLVFILSLASAMSPAIAWSQVDIDMGRITCAEYLTMPADTSRDFAAWMSGWMNQKIGRTTIDYMAFRKNVESVREWCGSHKTESVMTGLYQAAGIKN